MDAAATMSNLSVAVGGKDLLRDISVGLETGKINGVIGPSGAGKTTLIRSILGLQKLSRGTLDVLGRPAGEASLRSKIGYVTQAPAVYAELTVEENLQYFAALLNVSKNQVKEAIENVDLSPQSRQVVSTLSEGQRARVSLAAALLGKPEILLLDEPTVGLDPVLRHKLWGMFRQLAGQGITLLISSHVMDEADRCDTILFLREGRLLVSGSPESIMKDTGSSNMEDAFLKLAAEAER